MRRNILSAVIAVIAAACAGCDGDPPVICTGYTPPAITVLVFDAVTGRPAACGAVGIAIDGDFSDSLHTWWCNGDADTTGYEMSSRAAGLGVYTVLVQKRGYRDWTRSHVVVREGECGIIGTRLRAMLVPVDAPDVDITP